MKSRTRFFLLLVGLLPPVSAQYQSALPGYRYEFPRDHFNHEGYQTEWWYTTGNLTAADGRHYGFELTFFRQGVDRDPDKTKPWDVEDIYLAHLALSELDGGRFFHTERTNRAGPGLAGVDAKQQRIWNGNWELRWLSDNELQLRALDQRFSFTLSLHVAKPPVIHGENGASQKAAGAGHASHYISLTRLWTGGVIELDEKTLAVHGSSWMDHEFFTNQLDTAQIGWNWLGIQLEDNSELMLYQFRHSDGSLDPYSSGTFVNAQGKSVHLESTDFTLLPTGETWTSSANSAKYPVTWSLEIPKLGLKLYATTRLKSQELAGGDKFAPSYWEGAVDVQGIREGKSLEGVGYLEMTGYDRPFELGPQR